MGSSQASRASRSPKRSRPPATRLRASPPPSPRGKPQALPECALGRLGHPEELKLFSRPESQYIPSMSHIEKHPPGAFCWIELATTDQNAAKNFYGKLFGWTVNDFPMGPNDFYSMFQLEGRDTAAAYTIRPEQRSQGVPPHWMIYVAVEDADAATRRAAELGGKVLAAAFDVYTVGRMAVLEDPTGAVFSVWQAKQHKGTGIADVDGTLCWAELSTTDQERASRFYADLFGWKITKGDEDQSHNYFHIQ